MTSEDEKIEGILCISRIYAFYFVLFFTQKGHPSSLYFPTEHLLNKCELFPQIGLNEAWISLKNSDQTRNKCHSSSYNTQ